MSGSTADTGRTSQQPFQCRICLSRFTRNENLKRHAALHSRLQDDVSLSCDFCQATFSRPDLRHRHMKRKHPEQVERRSTTKRLQSDGGRYHGAGAPNVSPAESQHRLGPQWPGDEGELETDPEFWQTVLRYEQRQFDHNRQQHHAGGIDLASSAPTSTEADDAHIETSTLTQQAWMADSTYIADFVQGAADLEQSLLLGVSFPKPSHHFGSQMLSMAATQRATSDTNSPNECFNQNIPDRVLSSDVSYPQDDWFPSALQVARGVNLYFTHVSHFVPFLHQPTFDTTQISRYLILSMLCIAYQHGEDPDCGDEEGSGENLSLRCFHRARLLLASEEEKPDDCVHNVTMIQAYLLLQISAMMYLCGKHSASGLQMHSKMIFLARSGGLMQPVPNNSTVTEDLESLWREFIKTESRKRTLFAVHQIDALWYQFLSIPRSLSHLEIKHDLPCLEDCWTAPSAAQWAHRQLLVKTSGPPVQYADAVRCFLSSDPHLNSLPAFDPYGAINIAQFLISSAREITGWSTMTGRLSMERFEPLRSSLVALNPFIRPQAETIRTTHAALCEATWEMAMIELQMWSPSHTGGIVEGSVDAALKRATDLEASCDFLFECNTIQPHVDWFLRYLDETLVPDSEPPWITLYAYKTFLIAWRMVRGGLSGAMQVVGVHDGNVEGAMIWARKVFQRRQQRRLGRLIMACLDMLEKKKMSDMSS